MLQRKVMLAMMSEQRFVLQCVAVCCSVLQCVAVWCSGLKCVVAQVDVGNDE